MNERKIGIFIGYLNIFLQTLIGFLYVPMLLSFIGKSGYGLYQLIGSFIAYFGVMDFGLSSAIVRYYSKFKSEKNFVGIENLLAISMRFYFLISVVVIVMGILLYYNLECLFRDTLNTNEIQVAKELFILLLFNLVLNITTMVFRAVINGHERFIFLKGLETIQLILQPVFVFLFLNFYPSAVTVAIVQTAFNLFIIIARVYYCFSIIKIKIKFHKWDKELLNGFRVLATSIFIVSLVDKIFYKTNQVVLGSIVGADAVAVYSIAALIYMNYAAISEAVSSVYLPYITKIIGEKDFLQQISSLFIQIGRWQFYMLGLVASGFVIFGNQFIKIWAGNGFEEAYWITLLIIVPFTIDLIQNIGLSIMQAQNKYDFRAKVYFCMGIFNLLLAIPLANEYGGIGCAFATGLTMFLGNGLIMNWYYAKVTGLDIKNFWIQIGKMSIGVIGIMITGYLFNNMFVSQSLFWYSAKILLYTFVYVLVLYKWFMNEMEKTKVNLVLAKLFGCLS